MNRISTSALATSKINEHRIIAGRMRRLLIFSLLSTVLIQVRCLSVGGALSSKYGTQPSTQAFSSLDLAFLSCLIYLDCLT